MCFVFVRYMNAKRARILSFFDRSLLFNQQSGVGIEFELIPLAHIIFRELWFTNIWKFLAINIVIIEKQIYFLNSYRSHHKWIIMNWICVWTMIRNRKKLSSRKFLRSQNILLSINCKRRIKKSSISY